MRFALSEQGGRKYGAILRLASGKELQLSALKEFPGVAGDYLVWKFQEKDAAFVFVKHSTLRQRRLYGKAQGRNSFPA